MNADPFLDCLVFLLLPLRVGTTEEDEAITEQHRSIRVHPRSFAVQNSAAAVSTEQDEPEPNDAERTFGVLTRMLHVWYINAYMGRFKWQEFETGPAEKTADKIHATINRRGNIYLNERAMKEMGEPEMVVLMYDNYQQTIGVKASTIDKRNAFRPKRKDKRVGGRVLYAANFCRHFRIRPKQTLAFVRARVEPDGVLVLGMQDTMPAGKK